MPIYSIPRANTDVRRSLREDLLLSQARSNVLHTAFYPLLGGRPDNFGFQSASNWENDPPDDMRPSWRMWRNVRAYAPGCSGSWDWQGEPKWLAMIARRASRSGLICSQRMSLGLGESPDFLSKRSDKGNMRGVNVHGYAWSRGYS